MTHYEDPQPPKTPVSRRPRLQWLRWPILGSALLITVHAWSGSGPPPQEFASGAFGAHDAAGDPGLVPTVHPPVPARLEEMWHVPESEPPTQGPVAALARGVQIIDGNGSPTEALPLVSDAALTKTPVDQYARYYRGLALQRLNRLDEAEAAFASLGDSKLQAQVTESALYRRAEIREARGDHAAAAALYEQILARRASLPQIALVKLGAAASAAGNRAKAIEAHRRVLREFPMTPEAAEADRLLDMLGGFTFETEGLVAEEMGRADAWFNERRYDLARRAYTRVRDRVTGDERDRVVVRLAQIQAAQGDHRGAREVFRRYTAHAALAPEALYGVLSAARAAGAHSEANTLTEDFVARNPHHPLAEAALNEMARRYVLASEDEKAAEVYTRMVDRFPGGAFAERAAWKAGWWAYRQRDFAETIRVFERGAIHFPRSDYRPPWLYWTARAYDQLGQREKAVERYRVTATDYFNSYYGRLAWSRLEALKQASVTPSVRRVIEPPPGAPPNAALIKALIASGLYRPALSEVQYAQRMWGDSAPLQATVAFVHNRMGNLRPGITAMRRAYPQFMAAGGEDLPAEILRVIFPLDYWPLLKGQAQANNVDPFVIAALAAQESTFDPQIRSSANAIGLMQIIPPTGRRLAQRVGMTNYTERSLTNPEINARLGTRYFADMYREFGGYHYALAGYNAGEHRVRRWNREAPGLPMDEWIDNIPFPETQNYVKRILGTAEDYRRLYADGVVPPAPRKAAPVVRSAPAASAPAKKAPAKKAPAPAKKAPAKKAPAKKAPPKKGS